MELLFISSFQRMRSMLYRDVRHCNRAPNLPAQMDRNAAVFDRNLRSFLHRTHTLKKCTIQPSGSCKMTLLACYPNSPFVIGKLEVEILFRQPR